MSWLSAGSAITKFFGIEDKSNLEHFGIRKLWTQGANYAPIPEYSTRAKSIKIFPKVVN